MHDRIVRDRNKISKHQKESIAILCVGTFLEFFDLYLYIHMAVLLNDLFFPKTDHLSAQLLGATAFCSTYILRPVGGFIIGRIGDSVGRKFTILFTTFIMACTCIAMAIVPTYAEGSVIR
jgi:MHS family proline/betaine transporter-like MFS transporter